MVEKLLAIINEEDKKNPLTDEQIGKLLGISREKVNELRQECDISSYLDRRDKCLLKAIDAILDDNKNISQRRLCSELNKIGFNISTFGLSKYKNHIEEIKENHIVGSNKNKNDSNNTAKKGNLNHDGFSNIIGNNGSLSQVIKLAKAAVIYPPNGLHTLIIGNTGVGKSQLVESMYLFSKKVRNKNIPYIVFNCADYGDNPQLLVSQLFGHVKGSFTGADSDKIGLIEKANGGILFLDEIHRLPPKGQEILFRIIDKGEFNRLGETDNIRKVNIMIIGATTENIESNLLATFRRRVPVLVEIPALDQRPIMERMSLINKFLKLEAQRINKELYVSSEIIKTFLFYECSGNIGQLKSDIQVTCARAFLNFLSMNDTMVRIINNDLPGHLKRQLPEMTQKISQFNMMKVEDIAVSPKNKEITEYDGNNDFRYNIYQFIEKRVEELKGKNVNSNKIKDIIGGELEEKVGAYTVNITNKYSGISKKLLQDIVGEEVINIVDDIKKILLLEIGNMYFSISNVLCLHISAAIERLRMGKEIVNPKLDDIRKNYKREFNIALKIINVMKIRLGLDFPEDEAGFMALYLSRFFIKDEYVDEAKVGVILITHGEVAKSMLDIAQAIIGIKHGAAITMSLEEKPEDAYNKMKTMIKKVNNGKGVLILADMGSLSTFGDLIWEEFGIPTKTILRVDTLMVLEAIRKSVQSTASLESVFNSILEIEKILPRNLNNSNKNNDVKEKVIVTTCITGKGSAIKIKELVEKRLEGINFNAEIIPIGLIGNEDDILINMQKLQSKKEIIVVIGTVNPKLVGIPFISLDELLQNQRFELLINSIKLNNKDVMVDNSTLEIKNLFHDNLIRVFYSIGSKEEIINIMGRVMEKEGYVRPGFYGDVLDREGWGSSFIGRGVAISHAGKSDNIIRPSIGVAIVKNSIKWDEGEVDVVFMLALGTEHKQLFLRLYDIIKETDLIERIKDLNDTKLIISKILSYDNKIKNNV